MFPNDVANLYKTSRPTKKKTTNEIWKHEMKELLEIKARLEYDLQYRQLTTAEIENKQGEITAIDILVTNIQIITDTSENTLSFK
jgi:hypothetical protein